MIATFLYNFIVFVFVAVCFHILYNQGGKAGNTVEGSAYFVTDRINKSVFFVFHFSMLFLVAEAVRYAVFGYVLN